MKWLWYVIGGFIVLSIIGSLTRKKTTAPRELVIVDIPDSEIMQGAHFESDKPDWDQSFIDKIPLARSLTTTYVKR